jgi:DMSO/TMAO reductase YedYZ molybdopterin-dependent catalytic subunit
MRPHERGEDPDAASRTAVRLCGLADGTVACDAFDDHQLERVEEEFLCASGERWGGVWRGVPVAALLDRPDVDVDPASTHVRVGDDEYAVCVPIRTALGGVLAVEREGEPLPSARRPRFVAPVDAGRTVRGVRELRFLRLGPREEPRDDEALGY